ncbi:hypothetical protein HY570_01395 [Candidatus Micrarchaeota archaeon]|nr:hypothetical protein [Candidatus Micrarchaeota archaeon]
MLRSKAQKTAGQQSAANAEFAGRELKSELQDRHTDSKSILARLDAYVKEGNLNSGTKEARDTAKLELQKLILDSVNVPQKTRDILMDLLAKRMRICDSQGLVLQIGKINLLETIIIFKDLVEQIKKHSLFLSSKTQSDWLRFLPVLEVEVSTLEKIAEGVKGTQVGCVLEAKPQCANHFFIELAKLANILIINHYLGEESEYFHTMAEDCTIQYLNKYFPASLDDLVASFITKIQQLRE